MTEISTLLSEEDAALFIDLYQFEESGNYLDESTRTKTGSNIPHLKKSFFQYAQENSLDLVQLSKRLEKIRTILFRTGRNEYTPQLDDKVLTDWNGLMISAFARAGQAFGKKEYIERARKAADFCLKELRLADGRLIKRWRLGKAGLPAHLEDYAFLAQGLLDLYESAHDSKYLVHAKQLIDFARDFFEDRIKRGFF